MISQSNKVLNTNITKLVNQTYQYGFSTNIEKDIIEDIIEDINDDYEKINDFRKILQKCVDIDFNYINTMNEWIHSY